MALTNYSSLKTSIANWLNRSDLTSEISDDFIKLVEADMNSKLRVRKMITYTILGDTFRFMPKPDSNYTAYINYYKSFDALSDTTTTNYILTSHPSIYLYGSLFHAANFLGGINPQQVQTWSQMYQTAMERLELNDREDQFSGSPLQMRGEDTIASPFKNSYVTTNS